MASPVVLVGTAVAGPAELPGEEVPELALEDVLDVAADPDLATVAEVLPLRGQSLA